MKDQNTPKNVGSVKDSPSNTYTNNKSTSTKPTRGIIAVDKTETSSLKKEKEMRYIISTVQLCATVNQNLLRNMLVFADKHEVDHIYLFVMKGKHVDETALATVLQDHPRIELLFLDKMGMKLNNNLKLHDTKILCSQINPLTGFSSKLSSTYSHILPSAKIRYLSIPNTSKYPRFLATTGALTWEL